MIRVEVLAFGRVARITLSWSWAWSLRRCSGVLVIDAGPVQVECYARRMWWEKPW